MKIGIVDDNQTDQDYLKEIIENWTIAENTSLDIQCFKNGQDFLQAYEKNKFILVFMDIYMEEMTGIDVVREVRKNDEKLLFVFLTTSKEHIFEATPLHIFDYIPKPYSKQRLIYVLNEMKKYIPNLDKTIEFNSGKQHIILNIADIMYFLANNNFTVFKMKDTEEKYRIPFSKITEMVDERFLLCIRGSMINMDYILKQKDDYFIMADHYKIFIRRNNRKDIIKTYENYQFKQLDKL